MSNRSSHRTQSAAGKRAFSIAISLAFVGAIVLIARRGQQDPDEQALLKTLAIPFAVGAAVLALMLIVGGAALAWHRRKTARRLAAISEGGGEETPPVPAPDSNAEAP